MSYAAEITGLDLFTAPFRSTQTMAAPASSRGTARLVSGSRMQKEKSVDPKPKAPVFSSQPTKPDSPIGQAEQLATPEKSAPERKEQEPKQDTKHPQEKTETPESRLKPEPPKKELTLDMSDHTVPAGELLEASEDVKRKAHEEAEATRKAEWEAKQSAKKQIEEAALKKLQDMTDADAVAASTSRVRLAIEQITKRNMKECVAEYIQGICQKDPVFARCVMHPRKSLANCFKYINRMAKEYLKNEMEENGIETENGGYGGDVPDGICYQWAEDYFRASDVPEDREKEDKFISRPYVPAKKKTAKKSPAQKGRKKKLETTDDSYKQMSLEV